MAIGLRKTREVAAYHSTIRKEYGKRRMPIDKQGAMQWKSKTEEREKRLGMFGYKLPC
ncbi:MAG: hypothetical protein ACTTJ9_11890 [Segatella oris]|uniref:hypothetical protein n=1 Tax=Segatella oris TaxID=28135 RepID=UPI003FA1E251